MKLDLEDSSVFEVEIPLDNIRNSNPQEPGSELEGTEFWDTLDEAQGYAFIHKKPSFLVIRITP